MPVRFCAGLLPALLVAWAAPLAAEDGAALYAEHCASCHMATGTGVPYQQPSLKNSAKVLGEKSDLIDFVLKGTADWDPDDTDFDNVMPAFKILSDGELAAVLTHIRHSFGNEATRVTTDDIHRLRPGD